MTRWGHVPANCCDYDCPCVEDGEHNDDRCQCHYEVNDRREVGRIGCQTITETFNPGTPHQFTKETVTNAEIFRVLKEGDFLSDSCKIEDLEFEGDDSDIEINDARDGRPEFQLELAES